MKIVDKENLINIEEMLSSTTYRTDYFPVCAYCGKNVESDYYKYQGETYQPLRCNCEGAIKELVIKAEALKVLDKLDYMNLDIDTEKIKKEMYEYEAQKLKEKYEYREKSPVIVLKEKSGCGLIECKKALDKFEGNLNQAYEYLKMRGLAVCRRKADGLLWQEQDYIDWVKANVK